MIAVALALTVTDILLYAHAFEIHPVSSFAERTVEKSFDFIAGFTGHEPAKAFASAGMPPIQHLRHHRQSHLLL